MDSASPYAALQVSQHGSFTLTLPAARAFSLFSPEGERLWVPHWDPTPVFPAGERIPFADNTVFTLERDGELLTWWIIAVDRASRRADYLYMAASRAVRVKVAVASLDENSCQVDVTYITTSLTPEGDHHVTKACDMPGRMKIWKDLIETALLDPATQQRFATLTNS